MSARRLLKQCTVALLVASLLAGCSSQNLDGKVDAALSARGFPRPEYRGTALPEGSLNITTKYAVTYADVILVAGLLALTYVIVDPLAPNWDILEIRLPDGRVQYKLRMQPLRAGGDGEARQVMVRRAAELAREQGMGGFQVRSYSESLESRLWLPHRTAEAEVMLLPPVAAPMINPAASARPPLGTL